MSLYVRLMTSFWKNRKTLRLRAKLGNDALWIPMRLWSYAAENQPDGDFSGYAPEELGMLLEYSGDARAMLQAMLQAGFIDEDMRIHGWDEHNSYHEKFAAKAAKAAKARWEKERTGKEKKGSETKRKEKRQALPEGCLEHSMAGFEEFWDSYPKKAAKDDARTAWKKKKCSKIVPEILVSVRAAKASLDWTKEGGQFIPYPATWLNRGSWQDEVNPALNGNHAVAPIRQIE